MGYDSLRIELRYRHIWQTKWAAAANNEAAAGASDPSGAASQNQRSRRSTSLNRNVHYENEPDPGVETPVGNKPPPTAAAGNNQPANYGPSSASGSRGRHKSYRHYRYVICFCYILHNIHMLGELEIQFDSYIFFSSGLDTFKTTVFKYFKPWEKERVRVTVSCFLLLQNRLVKCFWECRTLNL